MEWAERNLSQVLHTERIAGRHVGAIRRIMQRYIKGLIHIHSHGFIHGDAKPRNFVRVVCDDESTWRYIDFDTSAAIGEQSSVKHSEVYSAPEYMREVMAHRAGATPERNPITANVTMDIWTCGVVFFELTAGVNLFQRDLNDDVFVKPSECDDLMRWNTPSNEHFDAVFAHADIDPAVRLLAQDLLGVLLAGSPSERPQSMAEVLQHPFLQSAPTFTLPVVPFHSGELDVVFSYNSRDEVLMRRTKRALRTAGCTTADGLEVPPGADWRLWYFSQLQRATVFLAIGSEGILRSSFCMEELRAARQRGMCVIFLVADAVFASCVFGTATDEAAQDYEFWAPYADSRPDTTIVCCDALRPVGCGAASEPTFAGGFSFWQSIGDLVSAVTGAATYHRECPHSTQRAHLLCCNREFSTRHYHPRCGGMRSGAARYRRDCARSLESCWVSCAMPML